MEKSHDLRNRKKKLTNIITPFTKGFPATAKVESDLPSVKEFVNQYELCEEIGQGTMGTVRRAYKRSKHQLVAVKIIKTSDPERVLPQINEFRLLFMLSHRNIIKAHEMFVDEENHKLYVVMEYFNGKGLKDPRLPRLDEPHVAHLFKQLLEALDYLHGKGVSHRDIHPDNILVDDACQNLKLIDFNVSTYFAFDEGNKPSSIYVSKMCTRTGNIFYAAPEMLSSWGYNEKVDIWSAGVVLFTLLCGFNPFAQCATEGQLIEAINSFDINSYTNDMKELSITVKHLLRKLLERKPEKRLSAKTALKHPWFINAKFFANQLWTPQRKLHKLSSSSIDISEGGCDSEDDRKTADETIVNPVGMQRQDLYDSPQTHHHSFDVVGTAITLNQFRLQEHGCCYAQIIKNPEPFEVEQPEPIRTRYARSHSVVEPDLEALVTKPRAKKFSGNENDKVITVRSMEQDDSPSRSLNPQSTIVVMERMNIFMAPVKGDAKSDILDAFDNRKQYFDRLKKIGPNRSQSFN